MRLRETKWLHQGCRLGKWQSQDLKASLSNVRSCALLDTTEHREKWDKGDLNFGVFFMTSHSKVIFSASTETNSMKRKRAPKQCYSLLRHGLENGLQVTNPAWRCYPGLLLRHKWAMAYLSSVHCWHPGVYWGILGGYKLELLFWSLPISTLDDYLSLLKSHRLPTSALTSSTWPFHVWDGLWGK